MSTKTNLERTLETLVELVDLGRKQSNEKFDSLANSLDVLSINVAQLAAQQKQTATNIDKLREAVERQNAAIDGHLRLSESQSV